MVNKRTFLVYVAFTIVTFTSCHVGRYFYWNLADVNDYRKFPSVTVHKGDSVFNFHHRSTQIKPAIPPGTLTALPGQTFEQYLEANKTLAFLVIKNDTIIYEQYFDNFDSTQIVPSFSVAKSFVSALTGIAIKEGFIKSVEQTVFDFLPEIEDTGIRKICIRDLLNMRSGIKWEEKYSSPFALMPKYYYGTNLKKYIKNLRTELPPDTYYNYQSVNTLLLSLVLEKATGVPINIYLQEKIWKPLGMESDASWSIDSKKRGTVKAFCCINAVTYDYARFGRLYLHHGNWNGTQLIPASWIAQTLSITEDSRDSGGFPYQYHWRVTKEGALFAKGVLGQFIYLDLNKELIIVRLGKANGKANWPSFFKKLTESI
ncbi:MAG: serine hydrolase domain-containing protein [Bacteroidales bacterium]